MISPDERLVELDADFPLEDLSSYKDATSQLLWYRLKNPDASTIELMPLVKQWV